MTENIYLIIGASSDIGIELIKSIDEDCLILAHYNSNDTELKSVSKNITNKLIPLQADLFDDEQISSLIQHIENEYGTPNKIVHLAAPKFENIRFKDAKWENYQKELDITLKSAIIILSNFLPKLAKKKNGKVVFMLSSVTLNIPPKALSIYTTSKYAMLGLMKSLASEYADKNIQINALSPSMIETKFLDNINEKFVEINAHNHPLKRNANTNDIVPIVKLLLSKESNYINGVNIPITGGSIF
jgi:3-oxoacyl-[acyl-carrier protein] reductase